MDTCVHFRYLDAFPKFSTDVSDYVFKKATKEFRNFVSEVGRVVATFTISEKRKSSNVKIIQELDEIVAAELYWIFIEMPAWTPAVLDGKFVEAE